MADASKQVRNIIVHNEKYQFPIVNEPYTCLVDVYVKEITKDNNDMLFIGCNKEERKNLIDFYKMKYVYISDNEKEILNSEIKKTWDYFFDKADKKVKTKYEETGIILDHLFFYMLYSFSNLFDLAFKLEECLFDSENCTDIILRVDDKVRRDEMKV